jgi:hypothetical protein
MKNLRTPMILIPAFALVILFCAGILAAEIGDDIYLTGAMRWRGELDGKDFRNSTAMNEFQYLRTRINFDIRSIDNALVYIQAQDSRNLGSTTTDMNNDFNLGIHQAYLKLIDWPLDRLSIQIGRFEAIYGRERLIGPVGWSNIGRSFDGIRGSYRFNNGWIDLFDFKLSDRSFISPNRNHKDKSLYGIYGSTFNNTLDLFFLFDWDSYLINNHYALARYTTGLYYHAEPLADIKVNLDAAFQGGKQSGSNISAFMIAADFAHQPENGKNEFGAGFDLTSGDESRFTGTIKYFDNLYYTGHKFRGYMDYFVNTTYYGLLDIFLKAGIELTPDFMLGAHLHHFQTMKKYPAVGGGESRQYGQEIDVTGVYEIRPKLMLQTGASVFFASDKWVADPDLGTWLYAMLNAQF